jgi:transposase-like protein
MARTKSSDDKVVYCVCPHCKTVREKINKHFTIIKRGNERNGIARFFCLSCSNWFNERTGNAMTWYGR